MDDQRFLTRLWVLRICILLALLVLTGRLYQLQILLGDKYHRQAAENMLRPVPIEAPRGAIFDRKGRILVRNVPAFRVSLIPAEIEKRPEILTQISAILGVPKPILERRLKEHKNPFEPLKIKENLSPQELAVLEEERANLVGVRLEAKPIRRVLLGKTSAHFLGYVGEVTPEELKKRKEEGLQPGDTTGKDGIEKTHDQLLRGQNGLRKLEVDATGRVVQILEDTEPIPGNDLYLTIDLDVQRAAEEGLEETLTVLKKKNGERTPGAVVALSTRTGGVLAHVSSPGYDPNLFSRGITAKEYQAVLSERHYPLLNRVIAAAHPCGSTFKLVTGTAALEEKVVAPETPVYCGGAFYGAGKPFFCFVTSGHGSISFVEALGQSCDVYFYNMGHRLGIRRLHDYARQFGIGEKTGIDLPGESPGLLPGEEWKRKRFPKDPNWYAGETINLSIGQGYLQVTPVQLAVVASAVANSGIVYQPHFLLKAISPDGAVAKAPAALVLRKVKASPKTFRTVRLGMRAAVDHGTSTAASLKGILVAGKTGTAENVPSAENRSGRNHAWFVCFAPIEKPEIVVAVCLEQSGGFGGQWAAPIARRVLEAYFRS